MVKLKSIVFTVAVTGLDVLRTHAFVPRTYPDMHLLTSRTALAAAGEGYQEALARARAAKAARAQGGAGSAPPAPPKPVAAPAQAVAAPAAAVASVTPVQSMTPPVAPPAPAKSPLPEDIKDAINELVKMLGERMRSGQALTPQQVDEFDRLSSLIVGEARLHQATQAPKVPVGSVQQAATPAAAPRPAAPQASQTKEEEEERVPFFVDQSFDVEEELDWSKGSVTLSGPAPGYKSASAFHLNTAFEEEQEWDTSQTPQPVQRGSKGMSFMEGLKGGMFYVEGADKMSEEEYRKVIGDRVAEMQRQRRQSGQPVGPAAAWSYMDSLKKKREPEQGQDGQQH